MDYINYNFNAGWNQGYADAKQGKPPTHSQRNGTKYGAGYQRGYEQAQRDND